MTEDLPHVVKTNFEQEHYHESKKSSVFAYTPGVPSLDELLVMDLDAYNYISAYLFEGMGTEEDFVEELDLDNNLAIFRKELLKSTSH